MFEETLNIFRKGFTDRIFSAGAIAAGRGEELFMYEAGGFVSYFDGALLVSDTTLFDMASMTKIMSTTMCALKLMDKGLLSPSDTLGKYFPFVPDDKKDVTVKQLMTHVSGLTAVPLYNVCGTPDDAAKAILSSGFGYKTGSEVRYSCMGFILLGKIMEQITGKPLNVLAKELVFEPLGMDSTGYRPVDEFDDDKSVVHTETTTLWGPCPPGRVHDENARYLNGISGNAGVFANLSDCVKFLYSLSTENCGISQKTFEIAATNYTAGFDDNRGLGFQLSGPETNYMGPKWAKRNAIGHTGYTGTSFLVDRDSGFYFILLTNRVHPTRSNDIFFDFRREIYDKLYDEMPH